MWILLIFVYFTHKLKLERYLLQKKKCIDIYVQIQIKHVISINFFLYLDGEEHFINNKYAQKCTSMGTCYIDPFHLSLGVVKFFWMIFGSSGTSQYIWRICLEIVYFFYQGSLQFYVGKLKLFFNEHIKIKTTIAENL